MSRSAGEEKEIESIEACALKEEIFRWVVVYWGTCGIGWGECAEEVGGGDGDEVLCVDLAFVFPFNSFHPYKRAHLLGMSTRKSRRRISRVL